MARLKGSLPWGKDGNVRLPNEQWDGITDALLCPPSVDKLGND